MDTNNLITIALGGKQFRNLITREKNDYNVLCLSVLLPVYF